MNAKHTVARSDIRPLEFTLAVVGGGAGSAVLSALQPNPWVSVGFALAVMGGVSFLRWRLASEFKDSQSLEAFAEDVYLLGYLLTLAALLGLAPQLMKEETNLFHIAGVKLFTTIAGLGVMMIFRQLARRWAEEEGAGETERFERQEELFRAAVARLNSSATELTSKMEEVARRFDPDLLGSVAEWSNRAANAFSGATRAFEAVPGAAAPGISSLHELSGDLARVKLGMAELATVLTNHLGAATQELGQELNQAGDAARHLGASVATLPLAADAGRAALEKLGTQALQEVSRLSDVNQALGRIATELAKVEAAMRQLGDGAAADVTAPLNRLVQALAAAADRAETSSGQLERLQGDIRDVTVASQALGDRLGKEMATPLATHETALVRMHAQVAEAGRQFERVAQQLEQASIRETIEDDRLATELGDLCRAMGETNRQLQTLIVRIDGNTAEETKGGIFNRLFGGGTGTRS
ncbi:MAG: hypothetical protein KIT22_10595 [Verrucomicrobiae bacterium]|nr:hypothetical protein [Verrucomicrobiae bacterium]